MDWHIYVIGGLFEYRNAAGDFVKTKLLQEIAMKKERKIGIFLCGHKKKNYNHKRNKKTNALLQLWNEIRNFSDKCS